MQQDQKQNGFSVIEIILGVVAVVAIATAVFYAYRARQAEDVVKVDDSVTLSTEACDKTQYLCIKEWGVKVKLGAADPSKVTYTLGNGGTDDSGQFVSRAEILLKDSVTDSESCRELGMTIKRHYGPGAKVVGSYSYTVSGAASDCGDKTVDDIRKQYTGQNSDNWTYLSI